MIHITACLLLAAIFLFCAAVFAVGKEKAAIFVSGFNSMTPAQRARYDRAALSRDTCRTFIHLGLAALTGALTVWLLGHITRRAATIAAAAVYIALAALFFRNVRLYPEGAFRKYLLPEEAEKPTAADKI